MLMKVDILAGELVVVAVGVISFSKKQYLSVTEVECLGVGFGLVGGIFDWKVISLTLGL